MGSAQVGKAVAMAAAMGVGSLERAENELSCLALETALRKYLEASMQTPLLLLPLVSMSAGCWCWY
jgi:hypothetical protein